MNCYAIYIRKVFVCSGNMLLHFKTTHKLDTKNTILQINLRKYLQYTSE